MFSCGYYSMDLERVQDYFKKVSRFLIAREQDPLRGVAPGRVSPIYITPTPGSWG
jgi:hypothetical protein